MPSRLFEALERRQLFAAGGALPSSDDIGSPGLPGGYSFANGTHSLDGSGSDIGGTIDQFRFAWTSAVQDSSLSARVASLSAASPDAKAGVMVRNTATGNAAMAAVVVTPANSVQFIYRMTAGSVATSVTATLASAPKFVRLSRAGFVVVGSYSMDGLSWSTLGAPVRVTFDSGASQAGLAVTAHNNNDYASASFTNLAAVGGGSDWLTADVGAPAARGSVGFDPASGTQTLVAGGAGISSTADAFKFVSKPLASVGNAVARVESLSSGGEAGVMIRGDATAGAPFAAVLRNSGGVRFAYRSVLGGAAVGSTVALPSGPVSLRVLRDGNAVAGEYSTDGGASWIRITSGSGAIIDLPGTARAGLAATSNDDAALATATFTGVSVGAIASAGAGVLTSADELFLDDLSHRTANWFLATQNASSGLFPDRAAVQAGGSLGGDASMASVGFGLSALVIATSRGWANDGYDRALRTLNFLLNDADMKTPANRGFFYHFVNQTTGVRSGTSELSPIDTALLMSGVLTAGQYWKGTPIETLAQQIYDRVDWTFMQPDGPGTKLRLAWSPEGGFSGGTWDSWSEGPLLYLLAMGSQTHPINAASWYSFARNQSVTTYAGLTFYHAFGSPLFTNQYPQGWFDLRTLVDRADADPGTAVVHLDPFQNSKNHTLAQRQSLIDAAAGADARYDYYDANAWGLTASDSANGYQVFGGPPLTGNVDGTIAPTAPGGSLAFTPRQSIDALSNIKSTYPNTYRSYGFVDAFNPRPSVNWYDSDGIGIDQGMLLVAAENLRSGLVWSNFMKSANAQQATALGFMANNNAGAPAIASSSFAFETGQAVSFAFTTDVAASLDSNDLDIVNLTTGQTVPSTAWTFARSNGGRPTTATVTLIGTLADGRYVLRVKSGAVSVANGIANVATLTVPFFVLAGDANRDGIVNFSDLVVLAQNYNKTGKTFSQGNFNYDAAGSVDFADLVLLAQRYGNSLAPATSMSVAGAKAKARPSVVTQLF